MAIPRPTMELRETMLRDMDRAIDTLTLGEREAAPAPPPQFAHILLAYDATAHSDVALAWAQRLALDTGARVTVGTIVPPPPAVLGGPADAGAWTVLTETYYDWADALVRRGHEVERDLRASGIDATFVEQHGSPAAQLAHVARDVGADLVILGARTREHPGRILLGTTAGGVAARTHASVLLARSIPSVRNVLAAVDGSSASRRAVAVAMRYAALFDADLRILHVVKEEARPAPAEVRERLIGDVLARVGEAPVPRVRFELEFGHPSERILHQADEGQADLIVLGSTGMGRTAGFLLGSVAQQVATSAAQTVLVVREGP